MTLSIATPFLPSPVAAQSTAQVPLAPTAIPQFVQPLPLLSVQGGTIDTQLGTAPLTVRMCEFDANVLPPGIPGVTTTRVWGYSTDAACPSAKDTYIGPVIVANRGSPTSVTYVNALPATAAASGVLAYKHGFDQTLHWADPLGNEANACNMGVAMDWMMTFADPMMAYCPKNYTGPVPAVPHLHGGEVPAELDGSPDSWFTSDGQLRGSKFYTKGVVGEVTGPTLPALPDANHPAGAIVFFKGTWQRVDALGTSWAPFSGNQATYVYPNTQEAAPLWFHDHTLGATRLNVYAGMAGAYYLQDPAQIPPGAGTSAFGTCDPAAGPCLPANLPPVSDVVPLVIQDRQFDTNGQLFFQAGSNGGILWALNPEHPYWSPEFVGDVIVVNGKAWPFAKVEPRRYRFLILNGSNARTYELALTDPVTKLPGPPMWVIGNDGGYLDAPQKIDPAAKGKLVVMPGERYEVIIDFNGFAGTNLVLKNTARTPYPFGATVPGNTLGRIMQFQVVPAVPGFVDPSYDPATLAPIRGTPMVRLTGAVPQVTRQLTLNEVMGMPMTVASPIDGTLTAYPGGPLEVLVNNTKWSGLDPKTMAARPDFQKITVKGKDVYFSETPAEGQTELWEIVNLTADAHPIHLHLVQFQIVSRQSFDLPKYDAAYAAAFPGKVFIPGYGPPGDYNTANARALGGNPDVVPFLQGPARPPALAESGWKDTVVVPPGMVTRIMVRFAPTDAPAATPAASLQFPFDPSGTDTATGAPFSYNYVWHCHIIDHEDNEMMRPDVIRPNPGAVRSYVKGVDY